MYNNEIELKYDFFKEGGTPDSMTIESAFVIKDEILKIAPKWFIEVEKIDRARGVLALAQFLQTFAQHWLTDDWNEYYIRTDDNVYFEKGNTKEKQLYQNWKAIILILQKSIWERCENYLDFDRSEEDKNDSKLQLESILELYQNYTIENKIKPDENSKELEYFEFVKPSNILSSYLNDPNSLVGTIQKAHILDKPKYILEILTLWKQGKLEITFEQFNSISEILVEISQIQIDDRWKNWFLRFYRLGQMNDIAVQEGGLAWFESLKTLKLKWSEFAKTKFLSSQEMQRIEENKMPIYRSIKTVNRSDIKGVLKNGKKIAVSGEFGVELKKIVSVLEYEGYEVLTELSKDCDLVLIGLDAYKILFKAKKYLVRQIDFLELLKILTNKNYQIN